MHFLLMTIAWEEDFIKNVTCVKFVLRTFIFHKTLGTVLTEEILTVLFVLKCLMS